ncbi:MAG TPA: isopentenyl phosphate kinase family protein [Candidatus Aciduliprofundum boonei]|uniref:Isopentenyl phosphate kinase n=1 Tax=Candidatus Aciduliprofundum boonei TaxID=379547 RepID=A0A7J3TA04_9ARCH|nr:isopentenyl phosphate kinase family protein [Candidatus Aciduliprofundum boonei]
MCYLGKQMKIIKIGGSALTDKKSGESYVEEVAERVAKELIEGKYVIIHGVGYIGHKLAIEYKLHKGFTGNAWEWAYLRAKVNEITREIVLALTEHGHPAVEISVPDVVRANRGEIIFFNTEIIREFLTRGFIPVMHGDGALDSSLGLSVISGDKIATELAIKLKAEEIIYGTNVDGILDENGKLIKKINKENINEVKLWENGDFSGGMRNKIKEALRLRGTRVRIINLRKDGMLKAALKGEDVGTLIEG